MDSSNKEKIYSDDDGEWRTFCQFCDEIAIDRYYSNHLKSQTFIKIFLKRQQLNNKKNHHHIPDKFNVFSHKHIL